MTTMNLIKATDALQSAQSVLVVAHVSPDGDAFGSMLGLGHALTALGKDVTFAVDGGASDYVAFLPGVDAVKPRLTDGEWDLYIQVDTSDEARSGDCGAYAREHAKTTINLDHHATNTLYGDIQLVDGQAVSATQVVFAWLKHMNVDFSLDIATPLLTGLVTDTLGFRTSNVTAETLSIAQELMQAGASLTEITERTLDNRSYQTVTLWRQTLATVKMRAHGIITADVTREALRNVGMSDTTDGGLVGFLIKTNEAMIAAVFKETPEGRVEISFRSKPGYDVAQVAFELGGGGHKQAAGTTVDGPLEAARTRVLPLLKAAAKEGALVIS